MNPYRLLFPLGGIGGDDGERELPFWVFFKSCGWDLTRMLCNDDMNGAAARPRSGRATGIPTIMLLLIRLLSTCVVE